jgi:hypothetical protein
MSNNQPSFLALAVKTIVVHFYWVNHLERKWLNWVMGVVFFLLLLMPAAGLLTR